MIYGFCGNMGAGKDTFADHLVDIELVDRKVSFAKKVKEVANDLFFDDINFENQRKYFQAVGEQMRNIDKDVWIKYIFNSIKYYENVCISDVRHINEAEHILNQGGMIFYLKVSDDLRRQRIFKRDNITYSSIEWDNLHQHKSESEIKEIIKLDEFHENFFIVNQESNNIKDNLKNFEHLIDQAFLNTIYA